jgi:hypothetical protein
MVRWRSISPLDEFYIMSLTNSPPCSLLDVPLQKGSSPPRGALTPLINYSPLQSNKYANEHDNAGWRGAGVRYNKTSNEIKVISPNLI